MDKIKLVGYTIFDSTFGTNTDNPLKIKAWISANDGCDPNTLGLNFISQNLQNNKLFKFYVRIKKLP